MLFKTKRVSIFTTPMIVLHIKFKQTKYRDIKYQSLTNGTKDDDSHLGDFNKEIY